ncbi:MAG: hypothetical protein R3F60_33365 [bacterium]
MYCTPDGRGLAKLVLRRRSSPRRAIHPEDVDAVAGMSRRARSAGRYCKVGDDLCLRFFGTGHLLGACSIAVLWGPFPLPGQPSLQRSILFSGDLGPGAEDAEVLPLIRFRWIRSP